MPYKKCSKGHNSGVRAKACVECGEIFERKVKLISQEKQADIRATKDGDISFDWATLQKGDRIKSLKGHGPYTVVEKDLLGNGILSKERVAMGYYGKFKVIEVQEDGILAIGNHREGENATCFIYMGTPCLSPYGIYREPHKLVKLKNSSGVSLNKKRKRNV